MPRSEVSNETLGRERRRPFSDTDIRQAIDKCSVQYAVAKRLFYVRPLLGQVLLRKHVVIIDLLLLHHPGGNPIGGVEVAGTVSEDERNRAAIHGPLAWRDLTECRHIEAEVSDALRWRPTGQP